MAAPPPIDPEHFEPHPPDQPLLPLPLTAAAITRQSSGIDLLDVVLIALVWVASTFVAVIVVMIAFDLTGRSGALNQNQMTTNAFFIIPTQFVSYLIVVGFMAFLAAVRHGQGLGEAVHWNKPAGRIAFTALGAGAVLGFCSALASSVLQRWIPKTLPIEQFFTTPASGYLLAAFGVLVAPLVEELFFRGFVYPAVARRTGATVSILITAAGFAALHGAQLAYAWPPLMVIFFVGVVLTVIRARTGSVAICVITHMGYNLLLFVLLFSATGGFHHMERV